MREAIGSHVVWGTVREGGIRVLKKIVRKGMSKKRMLEQKYEGSEGTIHVDI